MGTALRIITSKAALGASLLIVVLAAACAASPQAPGAQPQRASFEGIGSTGTWPFAYNDQGFKPGALLDLRSMNEMTAGETGFVRLSADGDSFVTGAGKPIRFWSVVSDVYRLPPEEMAKHARFLAKLGVNMVRLHTQIAPTGKTSHLTDVNEKEIDGIWRAVAALKKEGIYSTISPYWATDKDAEQWGLAGVNGQGGMWGLLFFNEKLQAGYKAWVKALYTPKNPYTGIPLAQDPSVGIIQVQNEDGMFFWTMQSMKPEQQEILGRKFGAWLVKKYGSLAAAKQAWDNTSHEKDDFAQGKVGLFMTYFLTQPQQGGLAKRLDDQTEFFADMQYKFYADIARYYHNELGCKQLINASNWITADPVHLNDLERYTYTAADVLAVNKYTGGVHTGENNGWRIDPGHHFTNQSCLLDPRNFPTNLKQVVGHPMIITESTWVSPEGFQSEGPLTMAAYLSLTGVDSFYWFAAGGEAEYEANPYFTFLNLNGQHPLHKWTCATPGIMGEFPAAALMFRLGYVKQGEPAVHEERTLEDLWDRRTPLIAEDRSFDPNRYTGNTGEKSTIQKGADPLAFLVGPVEVKYGGSHDKSRVAELSHYIDASSHTVRSNTGEIKLDYGEGLFTLNAPKAQGASGFLRKAGEIALSDITLRSGNDYATVAVVSMDGKALSASKRILVQTGTYVRPTGWQSRPTDFKSDDGKQTFHGYEVVNTGSPPWQVENTDVALTVKNPGITKAIVLDTAGYPSGEIAIARRGGTCSLRLPPNAMYVVLEGE
jgi:hypothetical protein